MPQFGEIALDESMPPKRDCSSARSSASSSNSSGDENAEASDELVDLITDRSGGNAFYVEELLIYLLGKGIDPRDPGALGALDLPDSLQSLVLSRIDTLSESPRRTLKVASVIGRVFHSPTLPGVYPELGSLEMVHEQLDGLRAAELVTLDQEAEQAYLFKHVVTQEVAYESLPFAIRAMLHRRVGAYIEATAAGSIERELGVLAHHYWHSDDATKKVEYLGRAGAAAQAEYANAAAIDYYERLVPLLSGSECVEAMLNLGKVLQLIGDLPRAEAVVLEARGIAVSSGTASQVAWSDASLAETARRQSHYEVTAERLETALEGFERSAMTRARPPCSTSQVSSPSIAAPTRKRANAIPRAASCERASATGPVSPQRMRTWRSSPSSPGITPVHSSSTNDHSRCGATSAIGAASGSAR